MRLTPAIAVALCCTSCQHNPQVQAPPPNQTARDPGPPSRWLFESQFAGTTYEFAVSDAFLRNTSRWRAEKELLPVTPNQAEQAAIAEARRLRPEVSDWSLEDMTLRRVGDECWYYEVLLARADQVVIGIPPPAFSLKIPVLMNGAAVHPWSPR
jgi:hypothetical protein